MAESEVKSKAAIREAHEQTKKLKILQTSRELIFSQLQTIYEEFKELNTDQIQLYDSHYKMINHLQSKFDSLQEDIISLNHSLISPGDALDVIKVQKAFDTLLYSTRGRYLTYIKSTPTETQSSGHSDAPPRVSTTHLPKLVIPPFSGRIQDWTTFHSLFSSIVHDNQSISAAEKFQFLRSLLKGDALAVISNYQMTDINYPLAFQALCDRYQNKRRLANLYANQIRDFKPFSSPTHSNIQHYLNVHTTSVNALKALNLPDLSDFLLFHFSLYNLDANSRKRFENEQSSQGIPSYQDLMNFILEQTRTSEIFTDDSDTAQHKVPSSRGNNRQVLISQSSPASPNAHCSFCKGSHTLSSCKNFLKLPVDQKYNTVKTLTRCFNCLGTHLLRDCKSSHSCRTCGSRKHHTMLHPPGTSPSPPSTSAHSHSNSPQSLSCCSKSITRNSNTVLLGTAQAYIQDSFGHPHLIRIILDPGSQVSAITEACVQRLGLRRHSHSISLNGISNRSVRTRGSVQVSIRPINDESTIIAASAVILTQISDEIPSQTVSSEVVERLQKLPLADSMFHKPGHVDFLLGADLYPSIIGSDTPSVIKGFPSAISSVFGWIIMGRAPTEQQNSTSIALMTTAPKLEEQLRAFWETEEITLPPPVDPLDAQCEAHFMKTHYRVNGRYVVSLPFLSSPNLGTNRQNAYRSYLSLETRLSRDPSTNQAYHDFLTEYVELGHMIPAAQTSNYVIPHHGVFKGPKIRVVFNASSSAREHASLNQQLMSGPKLQRSLPEIILKFRTYAIAFTTDIRMMYRQILLDPSDRKYQHIFWRPREGSAVQEFELCTVTYGLTPSAFLAQRVLHQLVADEGQCFPLASHTLLNDTYVDDIVTGSMSLEGAKELGKQLSTLLALGGFELRKWASNDYRMLEGIPAPHRETPIALCNDDPVIKVLGLLWDPSSDSFTYSVKPFDTTATKRNILSYSARIYDPLGWLGPVIFWIKHFLQSLWLAGVGWDDDLPHDLQQSWHRFAELFPLLGALRIPRRVILPDRIHQIVGFSDASEKGFSAVLYLVSQSPDGQSVSHLLCCKSKIAPLKVLSIPRLELSGALLLAKLLNSFSDFLSSLQPHRTTLFTDSRNVLCWLSTPPHKLRTFVANRVVSILDLTSPSMWAHVATNLNPADLPSRGLYPDSISDNTLWWHGPRFICDPNRDWPTAPIISAIEKCSDELKPAKILLTQHHSNALLDIMERFSSLHRLQRVYAWILRFVTNARSPSDRKCGLISASELRAALLKCIQISQSEYFRRDIKALQEKREVTPSLRRLAPFLDEDGLLRVGGRLNHSSLPYHAKHPLVLSPKSVLAKLICEYYHVTTLHSGPRLVQAQIQVRYWIIHARSLIRKCIYNCGTCYKFKAQPLQPYMASLPASRTSPARPFSSSGVDFAGPFPIKESARRNAPSLPAYLCLFVCMSTKAVHLELVSSLSTPAFLAAFDRFVARRGLCTHVYSDCGTNFKGASAHFRALHKFLSDSQDQITDHLSSREIHWHFNPPHSPNFGGLWEAGIKSVKSLLHKILKPAPLNFEELNTLFIRIEAILNSRPLCSVSNDPHDGSDYLSPGHFLIGAPLLAPPEAVCEENVPMKTRWLLISQRYQSFWKQWSREYLHSQMQRHKWNQPCPNLEVGDVVFLFESRLPPLQWPVGRVTQIHPGSDGIVRVASVHTRGTTLTRPVNKLIKLPSRD